MPEHRCVACERNPERDHEIVHLLIVAIDAAIGDVAHGRFDQTGERTELTDVLTALISVAASMVDALCVGEARRVQMEKCAEFFRTEAAN